MLQDIASLSRCTLIRHRRPACNDLGIVSGHIADAQGEDFSGLECLQQTPTFDLRQVLADNIHLINARPTLQQCAVHPLLVLQSQSLNGQAQQGRAPARNQHHHQIVFGESLGQAKHFLSGVYAALIRHRVRGLHHLNARGLRKEALWQVAIRRNHHTAQRGTGEGGIPGRFKGHGHGDTGLACTEHPCVSFGRNWQMRRQQSGRRSTLYSHLEQLL